MQRHLTPLPVWVTAVSVVAAVGLVVFLACILRQEPAFDRANDRVLQSSLLPDDWSTYGADVWSVGYPNTWEIVRSTDADPSSGLPPYDVITFFPEDGDGDDYFLVEKELRTREEIEAAFAGIAGVTRSEFRFAGYPAVKFSTYRRDEYVISYEDDVYRIATDHPKDDEVGIMLATVKFVE